MLKEQIYLHIPNNFKDLYRKDKTWTEDSNVLGLLSCEGSDHFLQYFKNSMNELIINQFILQAPDTINEIPQDFLINHTTGSFVEMVNWWIKGRMKYTPEELDKYFMEVIEPIGIYPQNNLD